MPETTYGRVAVMTSPRVLDYDDYPSRPKGWIVLPSVLI